MSLTISEFQRVLLEKIDEDRLNAIANPHQDMYSPETRNAVEKAVRAGEDTEKLVENLLGEFPGYYGVPTLYHMAGLPIPDSWVDIGEGFIKREWIGEFFDWVDGKWQPIK